MKLDDVIRSYPKAELKTIAVPMANNEEIIGCIGRAIDEDVAKFILIGEQQRICEIAKQCDVDLGDSRFVEEPDEAEACDIGARLVSDGDAQLMMKGLVQTSTFTRALLDRDNGQRIEGALLSHVALLEIPGYHKPLIMTDGGINIAPDVPQKAAIIKNALTVAHALGIARPKVALGSAVEKVHPKIQSTVDAAALVELATKGEFPDAIVEGPFGLDAILDAEAAEIKGIKSTVCGDADILLVPQIDSGNFFYKTLTKFCNARVAGVLMGAAAPAILTSRADTEDAKFLSICLAVRLVGNTKKSDSRI